MLALVEQIATIMLKVTGYVMATAPLAIFAALAGDHRDPGPRRAGHLRQVRRRLLPSLGDPLGAADRASACVVGPRALKLIGAIREPALLAFSTASLRGRLSAHAGGSWSSGASPRGRSFVLPLGYSFNLDGSMMYCTFATLFIAQVYGIHLPSASRSPCCCC